MNIAHIKEQIIFYKNKYGILKTIKKCFSKVINKIKLSIKHRELAKMSEYERWIYLNEPNAKELKEQRKEKFKIAPKISIIVPMYNTPENYF